VGRKFKNANRAKVKNPLPQWVDIPPESGYYWYWDETHGEIPPSICNVDEDEEEIWLFFEGVHREIPLSGELDKNPKFCGPIEVPVSPFLTEGLSEFSVVGTIWAFDADRMVLRHLRNHTEIDLEQDNYSGWLLWLREEPWFASYMEQEFMGMCEKYAPKQWMK
jgi:hypothetical protein